METSPIDAATATEAATPGTHITISTFGEYRDQLLRATEDYDEASMEKTLDRLYVNHGIETIVARVILPLLHDLGERWASGEFTIAHEHFAASVVRRRLAADFSFDGGGGRGPLAVLACAAGERHELGLLGFANLLRLQGWRVIYLGQDTPTVAILAAARHTSADLVVLASVIGHALEDQARGLRRLAEDYQIAIGGPGATAELAQAIGAQLLPDDIIEAAYACGELVNDAKRG